MTSRQEVYEAIDSERDYQDRRWNPETTSTGGKHSVTEFLVFMRSYVNEALEIVSRNAEPEASGRALEAVRKVSALGVVCMEQHGAPRRQVAPAADAGSISAGGADPAFMQLLEQGAHLDTERFPL